MNIVSQNPDWSKALKEARTSFDYHNKEAEKAKNAIPYLEEMAKKGGSTQLKLDSIESSDFSISKEEVEKYLNGHFIEVSNGRIELFAKKIAEAKKPLHYRDFVQEVNKYGDDVTENAFYVTVNRVAEKFWLDKKGGGIFALKTNSK